MRSLYTRPRLIVLLLLLLAVSGIAALQGMPRLEDPHMRNRVAFIITRLPGADAERVEALVTDRIEQKLREVAELDVVSSTSRPGVSFIVASMRDEVTDTERVSSLLRDKLSEVTGLPEEAGEPVFDDSRLYAFTTIAGLTWQAAGAPDYAILGRHAEELASRLRNVRGTDFVRIFGLPAEEVAVTLDEDLLSAVGLSAAEVAARLFAGDVKATSGSVSGGANRYTVEVAGEFDSLERIRSVPLATRADTGIVTVGDVARVERTHADPPDVLAYLAGDYGAVVGVRMLENQRLDRWRAEVGRVLDDYAATLPQNVALEVLFDQTRYTEARLSDLMENLLYGVLIVFSVLLITLGWRASLIAGSVLPLAALAALATLNLLGYQIEQMVVTGLIVGLGIMVDNAIVVTDEVQTRLLAGERRSLAVARAVKKLWLPLAGSTATTAIAFMPILLMPGNAGEFVSGISAAVIASLVASYLIAFTIISAVAGRVLGRSKDERQQAGAPRRWWREGLDARPLRQAFRRSLAWSVAHPRTSVLLAMVLPVAGILAATTLTEQFFPPSDRDQFHVELELPGPASIEETRRLVEEVHALVTADPAVVAAHWYIGQSAAKFYYNLLANKDGAANYAQAMVTVSSASEVDRLIEHFQPLLDRRFPHVQSLVRKLEQGPPYDAPIEIRIYGSDLETLRQLGEQVRGELAAVPDVIHTDASLSVGRPQIVVDADEKAAATLGLDLRSLAGQLRAAMDGEIAGSVIEGTKEVPVRVRTDAGTRSSLAGLRSIELVARAGRETDESFAGVPLTALAEVEMRPSVGSIPRRNGERVNTVQGFIRHDVLPETVFARASERLEAADIAVPPSYRIDFGGESEERNETVADLLSKAGVLAVLMVIAIVLTFNSFRLAAITFASAIQAAGLGLLCLWIFGYPLGFVVIIGLMGLVGLAINACIVILSELKSDPLAAGGDDAAIVAGVMATGRHVTSTTFTTVGGFMPLILSGSAFWGPFAVVIAGGTLLTMIVSFYFAPAAFKLLVRRRALDAAEAARPAVAPVPQAAE